jgi:hypothetical protein
MKGAPNHVGIKGEQTSSISRSIFLPNGILVHVMYDINTGEITTKKLDPSPAEQEWFNKNFKEGYKGYEYF